MSVIVFGATGEIGHHLARAIARYGHSTTAVVRSETLGTKAKQVGELKEAGVTLVNGSLESSEDDLTSLLSGFDVVVSAVSGGLHLHFTAA